MLLRFVRSTGTQIILFIVFVGMLLWLPLFLKGEPESVLPALPQMPLFRLLSVWITGLHGGSVVLAFLIVMVQAFWLVRLNTVFILINNRTYLPALFFVLITAALPSNQSLQPVMLGGFFLIFAFGKILESYQSKKLAHEIFQAAFFLALGSLLYAPLLLFMLVIWIGLIILRPFHWREWLFSILGFATPLFFAFSYYYLVFNNGAEIFNDYWTFFQVKTPAFVFSLSNLLIIGYLFLILLISSLMMVRSSQNLKILPRKAFLLMFWIFVVMVVIYLLIPQVSADMIYLSALPLSFLFGQYFSDVKAERWANLLLFLLFIVMFVSRFSW
jgi:hypothetical protein